MIATELLQSLLNGWHDKKITLDQFRKTAHVFVQQGADITATGRLQETVLDVLMNENKDGCNDYLIQRLLEKKPVAANAKNKSNQTPLQILMNKLAPPYDKDTLSVGEFRKTALVFIEHGADVTVTNSAEKTVLEVLLDENKHGCNDYAIQRLLKKNPDAANAKYNSNRTPLQILMHKFTISYGKGKINLDEFRKTALVFIEHDADVTVTNCVRETVLAVLLNKNKGGCNDYVIQQLLEKNPDAANSKNKSNQTPLQILMNKLALPYDKGKLSVGEFRKTALVFIEHGADVTVTNSGGKTVLEVLLNENKHGCNDYAIQRLLEKNPDAANSKNKSNQTPIQILMEKLALSYGNDKLSLDEFRKTVLVFAKYGAVLTVTNKSGQTVFEILSNTNEKGTHDELLNELLDYYNHPEKLKQNSIKAHPPTVLSLEIIKAINLQNKTVSDWLKGLVFYYKTETVLPYFLDQLKKMILLLAKNGANLSVASPESGDTLLHILIEKNKGGIHDALIDELLKLDPSLIEIPNARGRTPLHTLLRTTPSLTEDKLKQLTKRSNRHLYVQDDNEETLLHAACFSGNLELVKYLVIKGLDLHAKTNSGLTLWHYATANQNSELWQWLDANKLDINAQEKQHKNTPMHQAVLNKNPTMMNWLVQHHANAALKNDQGLTPSQRANQEKMNQLVFISPVSSEERFKNPATKDQYAIYKHNLYYEISKMEHYGKKLTEQGVGKGRTVSHLAKELKTKANSFFAKEQDMHAFSNFRKEFSVLLHSKNNELEKYRISWATIVKNIAIALTGVGALLLIIQLLCTNATENRPLAFFQQPKTSSEQKVANVQKALDGEEVNERSPILQYMC